ncbi:MAG: translation initiation factor IF-2 [Firmicutes bacterium]|nr:translation initiation factor IF-2 [Bacillota bacterium]
MFLSKVRVYELAREIGIQSKELVEFLEELGADVKNHMSTVEEDIAEMIKDHFAVEAEDPMLDDELADSIPTREKIKASSRPDDESKRSNHRGSKKTKGRSKRHQDRRSGAQDQRRDSRSQSDTKKEVEISMPATVRDLSALFGIPAAQLIKALMQEGIMATVNQNVDRDTAVLLADKFGISVKESAPPAVDPMEDIEDAEEDLRERPPVVTIMGHVDHGKTTLLDAIRETKVAAQEAGGITQHIGAYQVEIDGRKITFLDTPGHEAFTAMRSRGAQVTDIAVLVVAADDGVMPQTVEAINHAKAADVPIIVAVNKCDRENANPDRVKQELTEHGLIPEEWGGDTICVNISALRRENLDELLEMILLVAEMRELKANPNRPGRGNVIEAELDRGRGPVATVLVRKGTVRVGDSIVSGEVYGRVRAMMNHLGQRVEEAGPSTPVEILGFNDVPQAGDVMVVVEDEKTARQVAEARAAEIREVELRKTGPVTLDELFSQISAGKIKELNVIIKADVQGSVEAMSQSLQKLSNEEVRINVIHGGVGAVSETDVNFAAASNAVIIGFNVRPDASARKAAEREEVDIRLYRVIYDAIEDVKAALEGMLEPDYKEVILGQAEVRQTFRVPGVGTVAGSYVIDGKIARNAEVRVLRDNIVIHEGRISSLRRFKDDVREVATNYECGIGIERFNDIKEGDIIEAFVMEPVARKL